MCPTLDSNANENTRVHKHQDILPDEEPDQEPQPQHHKRLRLGARVTVNRPTSLPASGVDAGAAGVRQVTHLFFHEYD